MRVLCTMIDSNCVDDEGARARNNRVLRLLLEASRNAHNHKVLLLTVPRIVALVSRGRADNMLLTLGFAILANLAAGENARLLIAQQPNIFEATATALASGHMAAREDATSFIRNSCMDERIASRIGSIEGVIDSLLYLVRESGRLGRHAACGALINLCIDPTNRATMVQLGALDDLIALAAAKNPPEVRAAAADCIANLALDNNVGRILLRARATQALFIMATHEDHACVWKSAGGALHNFAEVYPEKKNFVRVSGLSCLTKMGRASANELLDSVYARDNETPRTRAARRAEVLAKEREEARRLRHEARKIGKGEGVKSFKAFNKYSAAAIRGRVRETQDDPRSFQY